MTALTAYYSCADINTEFQVVALFSSCETGVNKATENLYVSYKIDFDVILERQMISIKISNGTGS